MIIRDITDKDYQIINGLNQSENFRLAGTGHIVIDNIVEDDGRVIAYGVSKRNAEFIMLVDKTFNIVKRTEAVRELLIHAEVGAFKDKCDQLQCFVSEEKLARSLEKHFGFSRREEKILLVKNL